MSPLLTALLRPEMIGALAALVYAAAYAWRGRVSDQSLMIKAMVERITQLEARLREHEAKERWYEHAISAIRQEYEEYREAVSSGQTPPRRESTNPRFQIATEDR